MGQALRPQSHIISVQVFIRKAQLEFAAFRFPVTAWLFSASALLCPIIAVIIIVVIIVIVIITVVVAIAIIILPADVLAFVSFYKRSVHGCGKTVKCIDNIYLLFHVVGTFVTIFPFLLLLAFTDKSVTLPKPIKD